MKEWITVFVSMMALIGFVALILWLCFLGVTVHPAFWLLAVAVFAGCIATAVTLL